MEFLYPGIIIGVLVAVVYRHMAVVKRVAQLERQIALLNEREREEAVSLSDLYESTNAQNAALRALLHANPDAANNLAKLVESYDCKNEDDVAVLNKISALTTRY